MDPTTTRAAGLATLVHASLLVVLTMSARASADPQFVTVRDDGQLAALRTSMSSESAVSDLLVGLWNQSGAPLPEVMSVWTAFPFDHSPYGTYALNQSNDVTGIGLDGVFGGDGTFESAFPPVRFIALHNDVTHLRQRRALSGADGTDEAFARYLFLLELSHMWGPAARVPGSEPDALIGFSFHWSFFVDAGGSPAGGNRWRDNGDGTFTAQPLSTASLGYSPLDLYLMGLGSADDVTPFGVLEDVTVPADRTDPMTHRAFNAQSFPLLGGDPLTVTAIRRNLTIDDVVQATGARSPAVGTAPRSFSFGAMLVVGANATDAEIAAAQATFAPIAGTLPAAFADATGGRGSLDPVPLQAPSDMGAPDMDAPDINAPAAAGGCAMASPPGPGGPGLGACALAALWLLRSARSRRKASGVDRRARRR